MFKLQRYYSIASLVGIAVVMVALLGFYRHIAFTALMEHETRIHVALAQVFANSTWPDHAAFITQAARRPRHELPQHPEVAQLRTNILRQIKGLHVIKVKIYNLDGLTVFSTDPRQIGEDQRANSGFLRAKAGEVASKVVFRNQIDTFEQVLVERNLITSYLPIRHDPQSPVRAVFEVYSDVTDLVAALERTQWLIAAGVFACLSALYLFLWLIVRRADKLIRRQERERLAYEATIQHLAYHDALTNLPNRRLLQDRLQQALHQTEREQGTLALLFIDLDGFKQINDQLGHEAGDQLLKTTAARLSNCIRKGDTVARLGGDEFVLILPLGQYQHQENAAQAAHQAAQHTLDALSQPLQLGNLKVSVGASIGIGLYPFDSRDAATLLKQADAAMYRAKQRGRHTIQHYSQNPKFNSPSPVSPLPVHNAAMTASSNGAP